MLSCIAKRMFYATHLKILLKSLEAFFCAPVQLKRPGTCMLFNKVYYIDQKKKNFVDHFLERGL